MRKHRNVGDFDMVIPLALSLSVASGPIFLTQETFRSSVPFVSSQAVLFSISNIPICILLAFLFC